MRAVVAQVACSLGPTPALPPLPQKAHLGRKKKSLEAQTPRKFVPGRSKRVTLLAQSRDNRERRSVCSKRFKCFSATATIDKRRGHCSPKIHPLPHTAARWSVARYLRRARSGRTSTGRRRITGGPNYNSPASVRPAAWQRRRGRAGAAASGPVRKLNSAEPHGIILTQRGGPGRRAWQARQPATGSALRVHPTQRTRDVRSSARVAGAGQRKTWLL